MDNRNKKIVGLTTLAIAVSLTALVYAQTVASQPQGQEARMAPSQSQTLPREISALAVSGDEVFLCRDQEIIVLDRKTLEIKRTHDFWPHRPMTPALVSPPQTDNE